MSDHWSARCRCDLQSQTAQQTSSVPPGNMAFFLKTVLCCWENISGLCCCLAQFLISKSRRASQNCPIQGLGHQLICCLAAKLPSGEIAAFFLPHHWLFVRVFIYLFPYGLYIRQSSVLELVRCFFMLFTSLSHQSVLSGYISNFLMMSKRPLWRFEMQMLCRSETEP